MAEHRPASAPLVSLEATATHQALHTATRHVSTLLVWDHRSCVLNAASYFVYVIVTRYDVCVFVFVFERRICVCVCL